MEDMMGLLKFVLASPTAETPAGRLNYLQDYSQGIGFDPFGAPFEEQPFDADLYASQTRNIYGADPQSPYNQVFDQIDRGVNPDAAARAAINSGFFRAPGAKPDPKFDQEMLSSVLQTAKDYAKDRQIYEQEFRKHQNEQSRLRAEAPVSFEQLLNPNNRFNVLSEQLGRPQGLTTSDLADMYARSKAPKGLRDAPGGRRRGVRGTQDVPTSPLKKFRPGEMPGQDPRVAARQKSAFEKASANVSQRLKSTPVFTPKEEQVLRGLSYMSLLGGNGIQ